MLRLPTSADFARTENSLIKQQVLVIAELQRTVIAQQEEIDALKRRGGTEHEGT